MPWAFVMSLDLASNPGSFCNLDPDASGFVFNVVGVCRPCKTSSDGRFRYFERSRALSKGMGLVQRNWFHAVKRDHISAKIVSILAE